MLRTWLQFKRWLRSLLLALSLKQKINWVEKFNQLADILKKLPPLPPDPLSPSLRQRPKRKLRFIRLRKR